MSILKLTSFFNGVTAVIVFCLVDNVEFILFNDPSTYVLEGTLINL